MLNDAKLLGIISRFYDAFNAGDSDRAAACSAEDINVVNGAQQTATNRTGFLAAVRTGRDAGWTDQRVIPLAVEVNAVAMLYENLFADGSTTTGAGGMLFNDDGKICEIRTVNAAGTPIKPSA